jgi:4-amino-4-deoxy-L-arabinose transferase-like glycosyltransferase
MERPIEQEGSSSILHKDRVVAPSLVRVPGDFDLMRKRHCIALACFALATVTLQWLSGAYQAEFAAHPDEAAHYVTALMVREYMAAGNAEDPVRFAKEFYLHYPRVSFGMWPPLFHIAAGGWMFLFSATRVSVLLMMACCSTALAFLLYRAARPHFGVYGAGALGLLLISLPQMQKSTNAVMIDGFLALLMFLAAMRFARYLHTGRWQDSAWFGVMAALAILTKYNGFALALFPPLAVLAARRTHLLRKASFWLPAVIVVVVAGPWYLAYYGRVAYASEPYPSAAMIPDAMRACFAATLNTLGPAAFLIVAVGVWKRVIRPWRIGAQPTWAAMIALATSVWLFHSFAYALMEPRYLLPAAPALVLFFGTGITSLAESCPGHFLTFGRRAALLSTLGIVCYTTQAFTISRKPAQGFSRVADHLLSKIPIEGAAILVSADAYGEGMLVSEVALRQARPRHYVLRASKILASSDEMGFRYRTLYPNCEEILKLLETVPVSLLVLGRSSGREHHRQLEELVNRYSDRWQLLYHFPRLSRGSQEIFVYARQDRRLDPLQTVRIDMTYSLGGAISR